ncbi:unnamed protein product [Echinostoma caproni]|uniref:UNC-45/Cro1/She4 central domain-containing protein n=1 Tax=Echinostoma caproni TaxID=27848 RepID=A0A3P8IQ83_9TREM|nr:unnamed protein product [Echinostoma caproni]
MERLTAQYFVDRIFSRRTDESAEICRFLNSLLEGLTQLKAYHQAKEADAADGQKLSAKVAPVAYPKYKINPLVEKPVFEILNHLLRATNSYRLSAAVRDYILEMLIRFIPSEKGVGWSHKMVFSEGVLERLLELAGTAGTTSLVNWRSRRSREQDATQSDTSGAGNSGLDQTRLSTTPNTRMTVAVLLAKLWDDMTSDKTRDAFTNGCSDFILDLFADHFLETKVEAASVIGTLFLGPHEVGSSVLSRPGIVEGLFLLTQCPNMLYQTVALDTILLVTHKKEQCLSLVSQAVPILRNLYKSENDGTKIRALVVSKSLSLRQSVKMKSVLEATNQFTFLYPSLKCIDFYQISTFMHTISVLL